MPELTSILNIKRDLDYQEKKFFAGIQGVDLDKDNNSQDLWEQKKAKFFSGGATVNGNDVVALQGANAAKAGFGIGMGLDYESL
jgi:translation initiation factor 1 (eIF-1/SUI1)